MMSVSVIASPQTMANSDIGSASWVNVDNAKIDDGNYATLAMDGLDMSDGLFASNFGLSIPAGTTISGIKIEVKAKTDIGSDAVRVYLNDGLLPDIGPRTGLVNTTEQYISFGGVNDLWGKTWTVDTLKSALFGATFQDTNDVSTKNISVNHMRVTIYYTISSIWSLFFRRTKIISKLRDKWWWDKFF